MANRRTRVAEENGEVVGFVELEGDGHLDMLYPDRMRRLPDMAMFWTAAKGHEAEQETP